jgi:hypothetical protein
VSKANSIYICHPLALAFNIPHETGHGHMPCNHGQDGRYNCKSFNVARLCEKINMHLVITCGKKIKKSYASKEM